MFKLILKDAQLVLKKDPATKTLWEALFFSPGVRALFLLSIGALLLPTAAILFCAFFDASWS